MFVVPEKQDYMPLMYMCLMFPEIIFVLFIFWGAHLPFDRV